jgi:hypothetical protein
VQPIVKALDKSIPQLVRAPRLARESQTTMVIAIYVVAIAVEVLVDGKSYGSMRMRGQVSVPVSPGNHHVELRTNHGKSTVGNIAASSGDTVLQ